MKPPPEASGPDRVLHYLKTRGPQTASQLASRLGVTSMAVHQQLTALEADGLVDHTTEKRGVGRPSHVYSITDKGQARFPDSHADLAVGVIAAARDTFGADGLAKLIEARTDRQIEEYGRQMEGATSLAERVKKLAAIRRDEGYMAESRKQPDGSFLLIENHCPICAAATICQGLCAGELRLFETVLPGATVERTEHALADARRCAYRIAVG